MTRVKFKDVGRHKRTWEAVCPRELDYEWLYAEVKRNHALLSSDISFLESGTICAGIRPVGTFEIIKEVG